MKMLTLLAFLVFFGLVGPAFLYWFSRFAKRLTRRRMTFIGFPEDGGTQQH